MEFEKLLSDYEAKHGDDVTPDWAAANQRFVLALGYFHQLCSTFDLTVDYSIFKFLDVSAADAHLITSGMMLGRKLSLLADLIGKSSHPKRNDLLGELNKIRGMNKRDVITHGYVWTDKDSVVFLQRSVSGTFKAREHSFTLTEFIKHVAEFGILTTRYYDALCPRREDINSFAKAAISLNDKPKSSP